MVLPDFNSSAFLFLVFLIHQVGLGLLGLSGLINTFLVLFA